MRKFFPQQLRGCVLSGTVALLAAAALFAGDAAAQTADPGDPAYLDDRSTAEAVIRSLYNAIDRCEYARAYGYFAEEGREPDYEAFAAGYRDTVGVEVLLGEAVAEGAAGSTYWTVPTVVSATGPDGGSQVFSGCYVLRLAQPAIQAPPFEPLHIV